MDSLTSTPFQLMVVAWNHAERLPAFGVWDIPHAAGERHGYRSHQAIVRLLTLLVDKGYLRYDPGAGDRGGLYRVGVDRARGVERFADDLLTQLGDDPRVLELAGQHLQHRFAVPPSASRAAV